MKPIFTNKTSAWCCVYGLVLLLCGSCLNESKKQGGNRNAAVDSVGLSGGDRPDAVASYSMVNPLTDADNGDGNPEGIKDGSYTATVDYANPNTGYSATYTLMVEVSDGQVVQINFPNDGYLDDDHISPADLDEEGNADVAGEDGKTYAVHINL
ncbi:hypothetical protein [Mucilaginibacter sp. 22184]|uniref:hypothetical protein n=1 Tax=Mucilaginibacter sp. 22184 TaxID=3453887 RepID=UPI003F86221C